MDFSGLRVLVPFFAPKNYSEILRDKLQALGFSIEANKQSTGRLKRPVFFGEDGRPSRQYEIDGFHPEWRCGIEIEPVALGWAMPSTGT